MSAVPIRRQYLQIKARYPETLLLFRLGDCYEAFERDAETLAAVLGVAATARAFDGHDLAVAGFPAVAADGQIARLLAAGHKVAVCEQVAAEPAGERRGSDGNWAEIGRETG